MSSKLENLDYLYKSLGQHCEDSNSNCHDWIMSRATLCQTTDYIIKTCPKSCGFCKKKLEPRFDASRVPSHLQSISWLIGIWRSEHGGKAFFPTIPTFTYGEQVEISVSDDHMTALKALNYTAFAWGLSGFEELHSEYGYITVEPGTKTVSLTTVMNNVNENLICFNFSCFVTVEQGIVEPNRIEFHLVDIGRISFSRDLPVLRLIREWTLIEKNTLQARLEMETLTHGMQEHTFIRYRRIYP
uniref:ShKT domain-containing protein n=1 Tax=Elaeophora elaphi TaxID=1147741 RepID=A0A0R3RKE1_9BILA